MKNHTNSNMERFACTTMIVGKDASADGSVIVAHSDDDVADERVIYVPARAFKKKDRRNVYYDNASLGYFKDYNYSELYRYIGKDRGPGYRVKGKTSKCSKKLGSIPQYPEYDTEYPLPLPKKLKTYAYFDSNYGIMNEHSLMFGECTCGAKVHPEPEINKRIFYSAELSRVALERCTNAVDAIKLMGYLIKKYGYYGTGETLLVGDSKEAWVMEMCGYDEDGGDGIWVAQRVPDKGYFVAANEFRIRQVKNKSKHMMYSDNLFDVCQKKGWWDPKIDKKLDWLPTVSWGEYAHPYYSLRRVWRAMSKVKPSANLPAWVEDGYTTAYPFSIEPDQKLSVADIASIYRDHYEGTQFDLTKGLAAGPFGNPARYEKNPDQGNTFNLNTYQAKGAWERPISIYRCGMMWINQARPKMPKTLRGISWIGLDRPANTCLMPFFAGVKKLPKSVETMNLLDYSQKSAWWAFNYVSNYANIKYCYMIEDIRLLQRKLEQKAMHEVNQLSKKVNRNKLTRFCDKNTAKVVKDWWKLSRNLIVKYNDGCLTTKKGSMKQVGYQNRDWLKEVGYYEGPTEY